VKTSSGTNLPPIEVPSKAPSEHKTLSHALSRAATSGSLDLASTTSSADSSGSIISLMAKVLKSYAMVQARIGDERIAQDGHIQSGFLQPWQTSLNLGLQAAMKSRGNVRSARYMMRPNKPIPTNRPLQKEKKKEHNLNELTWFGYLLF
jgi:hypothetical protein